MKKQKTNQKTSQKTKKIEVLNLKGSASSKKAELNSNVFDGKINTSLLHEVITGYQAAKRAGTASTKGRADMRGGGKKPWRQKGTGRARTGSIRNPIWRGGGVTFGPSPRDFSKSIPKKAKKQALKSALCAKLKDEDLLIISSISIDKPKTKLLFDALAKLFKAKKLPSMTIVLDSPGANIKRAAANIPGVSLKCQSSLNAFDVMRRNKLICSKDALDKMCERILQD